MRPETSGVIQREARMTSPVLGTTWLVLVAAATLGVQGQSAAPGQRGSAAPRPRRAVIVTGENSYNGHVWKDTSAEIKNILDAGKDFAGGCDPAGPELHRERRVPHLRRRDFRLPQPESARAGGQGRGQPPQVPRTAQRPRDGALGERRVPLLARVREHRGAGAAERARSPGTVHRSRSSIRTTRSRKT